MRNRLHLDKLLPNQLATFSQVCKICEKVRRAYHELMQVEFRRGIFLPNLDLWLDPWDEQQTAFVSHAHSDHIGNHREVILSQTTARLMAARLPGERIEHQLAFHTEIDFRNAAISLLPAGHILGSAQIYIETEGKSLLYTGDFKLRPGKSAEAAEWRHTDTLIMETTYGLPRYQFPPTEEIISDVTKFCVETLEDGHVPILFGYSLGKAQEILAALRGSSLPIRLHPSVYKMTKLYEELYQPLPEYHLYDYANVNGSVLICPPGANRTRLVQQIKNRRTAILTGWALQPGAIHRYQCDAAFPLSDHADYCDLLQYVDLVRPERVFTVHGFAREFAEDLRHRGIEAWCLGEDNQLELTLPGNAHRVPSIPAKLVHGAADSGFSRFSKICDEIKLLTGKRNKIDILSVYLRSLTAEELPIVATFLTGHAFSRNSGRPLQIGWAIIRKALMQAGELTEPEFRSIAAGYGDAGQVAYEILLSHVAPIEVSIRDVAERFALLQSTAGPVAKASFLGDWLRILGAQNGSYAIRILTGDLRIGLKEGLLEEAIAAAFELSLDQVKEANMLTGDIGEVALLARENRLESAILKLFRPAKSMLAIPESSAAAIWNRVISAFQSKTALAERKYDGIRAQLHADQSQTKLYSRDLRDISAEFPELTNLKFADELILDGEILAFDQGKKLSFFDLQRRLGRKRTSDLFETDDVPVIYMVFDLLRVKGESLLKTALRERRQRLNQLIFPDRIRIAPIQEISSLQEIDDAFSTARLESHEGLMIKDPDSFYTPGRRGGNWIKFKKELATLDVVVVGVEEGHGKRSHVLSDYTFAVRDQETGSLEIIGKAYSGLTDREIEDLTEHFIRTTIRRERRFRQVIPEIVLEVAFDSVQPSDRHSSGLALRFPRIKRVRREKTVGEIDTLQHARSIAGIESKP
ncbi:MAG TPA: ATP-dependent DNA ligase [Chthoniobacterales bacterium]|nr:ATP-dependent DNA ligase [Chthoniobacterales bacterium]